MAHRDNDFVRDRQMVMERSAAEREGSVTFDVQVEQGGPIEVSERVGDNHIMLTPTAVAVLAEAVAQGYERFQIPAWLVGELFHYGDAAVLPLEAPPPGPDTLVTVRVGERGTAIATSAREGMERHQWKAMRRRARAIIEDAVVGERN